MYKLQGNTIIALLIFVAFGFFMYAGYESYKTYFKTPTPQLSGRIFDDHYFSNVQKVFDQRCIACHSCFNAPCQLNLTSYEGAVRGASQVDPYKFPLLEANPPTRLGIDATTEKEWRKKKFFSVLNSTKKEKPEYINDSILLQLVHASSKKIDKKFAYEAEESRTCPSSLKNSAYLRHHSMPFGFPRLEEREIEVLTEWVLSGYPGPQEKALKIVTESQNSRTLREIENWENLLNKKTYKNQLSARYFYEHLFSAHIYFNDDAREFFRIVRAKNSTGLPEEIATVRPFDDPKTQDFYYRFKKVSESIVHKTHTVFLLNNKRFKRFEEEFINSSWDHEDDKLPGYGDDAANAFLIFKNIPVKARYRFFLENARYFVMTFMKGPVCRGQTALNVINDHFWVMFIDPKYDVAVNNPTYLSKAIPLLAPPATEYNNLDLFNKTKERRWDVHKLKTEELAKSNVTFDSQWIWNGFEDVDPNALLTVYRHFDSSNVLWGAQGVIPKTIWVMDYQIFEDIYYNLVVGYNVFGPVLHQINTRLYMDVSRIASEDMFINFMPKEIRTKMRHQWSQPTPPPEKPGVDKIFASLQKEILEKVKFDYKYEGAGVNTNFVAQSDDPKKEFLEYLMENKFQNKSFYKTIALSKDVKPPYEVDTQGFSVKKESLEALKRINGIEKPFVKYFPDVTFLKLQNSYGNYKTFSIVRNKFHYNVSMMFFEDLRRNTSKDTLDILPGYASSYPNYFLSLDEDKVLHFVDSLENIQSQKDFKNLMIKYGISRSSYQFWPTYDWFNEDIRTVENIEAGVLDLNRYANY